MLRLIEFFPLLWLFPQQAAYSVLERLVGLFGARLIAKESFVGTSGEKGQNRELTGADQGKNTGNWNEGLSQ
jgi:hypothetical protein